MFYGAVFKCVTIFKKQNKTSWLVWFSKTEHTKQPSSSQGDSGSKECHLDHMQRVYIYKHSYYFFSCMEKNW